MHLICHLFENSEIPKLVENILFEKIKYFKINRKCIFSEKQTLLKNILKLIPEV